MCSTGFKCSWCNILRSAALQGISILTHGAILPWSCYPDIFWANKIQVTFKNFSRSISQKKINKITQRNCELYCTANSLQLTQCNSNFWCIFCLCSYWSFDKTFGIPKKKKKANLALQWTFTDLFYAWTSPTLPVFFFFKSVRQMSIQDALTSSKTDNSYCVLLIHQIKAFTKGSTSAVWRHVFMHLFEAGIVRQQSQQ